MSTGRVVAIAAWATLACVVAVLLTAAVGVRTYQTELSSKAPLHGVTAKSSREGLSNYFRKQSLAIKQQLAVDAKNRHMTAAAANADLNKYFDSLQAHTKKGKLETLAKEVTDLSKDVKDILQPVKQLQDSALASKEAVSSLKLDTKELLRDEKAHQEVAERAEKAAEKAANSAADAAKGAANAADGARAAANRKARDETVVIRQALHRAPKYQYQEVNPKMTVEGLPPHWSAYMDLKTKYAYFYNKRTGKSSWINPKGSRTKVKGLPAGWEALTDKGNQIYYVNLKTGKSTREDPRVIPGEKVLAMVNGDRKRRAAMHRQAEKMAAIARQTALADDHGVLGHNFARSQWTDKDWMHFLDNGHAAARSQELLTSNEQLRRGLVGSEQAMPSKVASDSY